MVIRLKKPISIMLTLAMIVGLLTSLIGYIPIKAYAADLSGLPDIGYGNNATEDSRGPNGEFVPKGYYLATDGDFELGGYGGDNYWQYVGEADKVAIPHKIYDELITSYKYMFSYNKHLEGVASNNQNVISMEFMFYNTELNSLEFEYLDVSEVRNMNSMFHSSKAITLNLSSFDTSNVNSMQGMFYRSNIETLDLSNFDTSKVNNMMGMFEDSVIETLDLSSFNTSMVTTGSPPFGSNSMSNMFTNSTATTGYARTQIDADKFNNYGNVPVGLTFTVKEDEGTGDEEGIEVFVDSNKVNFPDKQPTISNENILVPIRFVMEELNFKVYWDTVERKAVLRKTESDGNKLEIIMEPNKSTMLVNGSSYPLGAKVRIESPGRLMLPGGELVKAMKDIYYKQETPSSNLYQGFYYSEDVEGTESKLSNIPEIDEWTDNSNLVELTDANEEEVLSDLPSTGDEGGTGGDNPIDEGMASEDSNLQLIGLVESITTLDVDVPLSINFIIDAERNFIKPIDLKIVSNCPAPLKVLIYEVDKKTDAPNIVKENTYTDSEWNNLNRKQTSENIALSLNNINLSTQNVELGTLKSAFKETQELDIELTSKYGKAWSNKEEIEFSYNLVLLIEMQ